METEIKYIKSEQAFAVCPPGQPRIIVEDYTDLRRAFGCDVSLPKAINIYMQAVGPSYPYAVTKALGVAAKRRVIEALERMEVRGEVERCDPPPDAPSPGGNAPKWYRLTETPE